MGDTAAVTCYSGQSYPAEGLRYGMSETVILEGWISVYAAIKGGIRKIRRIYIDSKKNLPHLRDLRLSAEAAGTRVEIVDRQRIEEKASGNSHGGVIALAEERQYTEIESLVNGGEPLIFMIDGVEDPFNLGYAMRSLYAFGADGIVLRTRNWSRSEAVVVRSSAGASELLPIAVVETPELAAGYFRKQGLKVACTSKRGATSVDQADLTGPLFLLIGGEKRGISRSFRDCADQLISIPYGRHFNASLTAGGAAAVIAFTAMQQRSGKT